MKKGQRNLRNIIILVCVCAGLATAYFLITANEDPAAAGVLIKLGNDKIEQIEIDNQYGSFIFGQQDGVWVVESDGTYRTNPKKIDLLLASLEEFAINRMLPDEKSDYGFDTPQAEVSLTTSRGKEYSFTVGAEAIPGVSVYIKSDGDIMLTSTAMTAQLTGSLNAYRAKDVLMVDPSSIRSIDYYVKGEKTLSVSNTDYQNWTMQYPFEAPVRKVVMNELISKMRSLVIAGYVDSGNIPDDMGLDNAAGRMVITDEAGVEQTLEFGAVSGNLEYVRIGAEDDIVQLYAIDLDFSKLTPAGVMYVAPFKISTSEVRSLSIQSGEITDTIILEHNGEKITAYLNGAIISFSDFVAIYYKAIALNADGYETGQANPGECVAVCNMILRNGETIELSLYSRDDETLYMYLDGQMLASGTTKFFMQRSSLSELLYRLQSTKGE